jgi:hypothetical protein
MSVTASSAWGSCLDGRVKLLPRYFSAAAAAGQGLGGTEWLEEAQ